MFVNLNNSNLRLDKNIFVPFGVVIGEDGMKTFDNVFSGYGQEPDQVHNALMQCMSGQCVRRRISYIRVGLPISHPIFLCCPLQTRVRKQRMFLGHRLTHRSGRQALAALAKSKGMLSNIRHQQLQHDLLDAVDGFFLDDACSGRLSLQSLQHRMLGKIALAVPRAGNGGEFTFKCSTAAYSCSDVSVFKRSLSSFSFWR